MSRKLIKIFKLKKWKMSSKEHEWGEVAELVKWYILSTGNEVNETTIAYAIIFSKKWDNLNGKDAAKIRNLLLVRPTPIDFHIKDNIEVVENNKWDEICELFSDSDEYTSSLAKNSSWALFKWLKENYEPPEKKNH